MRLKTLGGRPVMSEISAGFREDFQKHLRAIRRV